MTYRMYGAFVAFLSAAALALPVNETLARPAGAHAGGAAAAHSGARLQQHRRGGGFWPGGGGFFYGPSSDEPLANVTPPASGDVHYTYTYDVPWDWAHRYPPNVTPSDRAYVPECPTQTVTVPGAGGREQTVNIVRCY
jgi:hypothetical protein